jgi:hypothetical protein
MELKFLANQYMSHIFVVIIVQSVLVSRLLEKLITLRFPHRRLLKPHFIDDSKIEPYCKRWWAYNSTTTTDYCHCMYFWRSNCALAMAVGAWEVTTKKHICSLSFFRHVDPCMISTLVSEALRDKYL